MEILTSRILLRPTDIDRSLRFYEQTVGLAIYREWGTGPGRSVVFFLGGGGLLELSGTSPDPPSVAIALVLQVRDVVATHQRLTERGVAVDAEPERKPWGLVEMTVRDPDGLALIIVEVPPEHPRRRGYNVDLMPSSSASTTQHPIDSGFGAKTTAAEVLHGIDLTGRLALVTGGYSGIGIETTRALSNAGATVIVPARRPDAAHAAVEGIPRVQLETLDLGDLDSVTALAERLLAAGQPIDLVINSAGIMACPETRVGDGWEAQFATNHLGHFALINRIWPLLAEGGARVVSVSSRGHQRSAIRWDDIDFRTGYDKWEAYGQAKTANVLFAVWLDRLGRESGVRAFAVHPGGILTPLQRHLAQEEMQQLGWIDEHGELVSPELFKTPEQGAATQLWAATSSRLSDMGGVYCENCDVAVIDDEGTVSGVRSYAIDLGEAERLWALSVDRAQVDAFSYPS